MKINMVKGFDNMLEPMSIRDEERLSKFRSLDNWHSELVDPETLLPVGEEDSREDEDRNRDDEDGELINKRVLCF